MYLICEFEFGSLESFCHSDSRPGAEYPSKSAKGQLFCIEDNLRAQGSSKGMARKPQHDSCSTKCVDSQTARAGRAFKNEQKCN